MKGAKRGRCGWHIVNRNFSTHVLPKKSFPGKETDYDNVTLIVQNWIYSWMKDDCETRSEFLQSKQKLTKFLESERVLSTLGAVFSGSVMLYLKKGVEPLENNFCYYLKNKLRHYGAYSNCEHEGTNNGIKYCTGEVSPRHKIENSCSWLRKDNVGEESECSNGFKENEDKILWRCVPVTGYSCRCKTC